VSTVPRIAGLRIAVVGAGLAGLSAAWWLGRAGHRVTLYERQPRPGFTAASVTAPGGDERVDVPLRVFYPGYYPTLTRLYDALGVASEPVSYAASFMDADGRLFFRYRNWRLGDRSLGYVLPQDALLAGRGRAIVRGLLRFRRHAVPALARGALAGQTLGALVRDYPAAFVDDFLLPAVCTVCTCTTAAARRMPAEVVVDYVARGVTQQAVRRVLHGADEVERRLREGIPRLRCAAPVAAVKRNAKSVTVRLEDGTRERHDHVVFAAPAPHVLAMLADADRAETAALAAFRYQPVAVVTHTDAALLPARRRDWSPVNLRIAPGHDAPESTIWVNAVQPSLRGRPDLFQTVHPQREPAAASVIGRARFERPVVDAGSQQGLARLQRLHAQPDRRVWFCGSYAQAGVPLLESAVGSALAVVRRLGVVDDGTAGGRDAGPGAAAAVGPVDGTTTSAPAVSGAAGVR
jgi:predicted NAD/FAD-binding protein